MDDSGFIVSYGRRWVGAVEVEIVQQHLKTHTSNEVQSDTERCMYGALNDSTELKTEELMYSRWGVSASTGPIESEHYHGW